MGMSARENEEGKRSRLGSIDSKKNGPRSPSMSRDTVTSLQRVDHGNTPRRQSSAPQQGRSRAGSVEYVPRRDDQPPQRRFVVVQIEEGPADDIPFYPVYFETKEQRRNFVRIVYMILGIMLAVDFSMVAIAYFVEPVNTFVRENIVVYIVAFLVFIIIYLLLACIRKLREKKPVNYIMLSILCLSMGYLMATATAFHSIEVILFAVAGTLLVVVCVTMFAIFCPCDMTGWGLYLCVAGMGLLGVALIVMIVCLLGLCGQTVWIVELVISSVFVVLFSFYLAYDTQLIMGGKRYSLRPDEYVNGALHLWIDIVYIFLCMLTIGRITAG